MKSYEDIAERVFRKGEEILATKRRRTAIIKKISITVSGMCAVAIVGFGVWKDNNIKNAVNDYSNDFQIITENDDTSVVTTNTESIFQAYGTSVTTVSDDTEIHTVSKQTTTASINNVNSNTNTITITLQTSSLNEKEYKTNYSKETQTIPLEETVQTTVSTTLKTDLIVTTTTTTSQNVNDERSLYMKKLASFISVITITTSVMPTISNASGVPFKVNPSRYWPGEEKIFAKMESGELDVDINGNGEFDIMDCYLLDAYRSEYYSYEDDIDPEIVQRIESIADYDGNGTVDFDDTLHLMRYFIVDGNIKYEYLNPAYYDPDIEPLTTEDDLKNFGKYKEIQAYCFPMRMFYHVNYLNAEYYLIDELYNNGTVDLDFNGNGQLDVDDVYRLAIYYEDEDTNLLTDEEYQRCDNFFLHYSEHLVPYHCPNPQMDQMIAAYILNHIEVKPEYFTVAYYKDNIEDYVSSYNVSGLMVRAAKFMGIEVSDNIGPTYDINDFHHILHMDKFTPFFDSYCSDVENGIRSAPDVNMDGVVDYRDYFDINIYWSDKVKGNTAERSILPEETWNNIDANYDLDGDGYTATIYDLTAVQLYVIKYVDEIDDVDGSYNEYVKSLCETPETISATLNYDNNVKILLDLDTERSGDANNDGKVNISDAVLIMQSITNPSEYSLTLKGQFNADVCNTGDGITNSDALQIQMWEAKC